MRHTLKCPINVSGSC
jgi:hypothetical protein